MQAVVLAGGLGARLGAAGPKPLVPVAGLPVLAHVIAWLAREGVRDIVLCTGYGHGAIAAEFGDGSDWGVRVRYSTDPAPLGTAGAVKAAEHLLSARFFVAYADIVADVALDAFEQRHRFSGAVATLAVHPNDHPFDSDRVLTDVDGFVTRMLKKEDAVGPEGGALCSAALYVLERAVIAEIPLDDKPRDFGRDVFPALVARGKRVLAYRTTEYLHDMGTPARHARVDRDVRQAVPRAMRRSSSRRAVFLDRDGVLVADTPFIHSASQIEILPEAADALRELNAAGTLAVCCTNQPVVARGEITLEQLHTLHTQLEGLLGAQRAWLDAIYVCPHHPDAGFTGERRELKLACRCRKPLPGLLLDAIANLGVDRGNSIFVGDRTSDLRAAEAAGLLGVGVRTGAACRDGAFPISPEAPIVSRLNEAVALAERTAASWGPWLDDAQRAGVVAIGGKARSGKTVAASALRLALQHRGVPVLHLNVDRFPEPSAPAAIRRVMDREATVIPGYDASTGRPLPSDVLCWNGQGVLVLEGRTATTWAPDGALRIAIHAAGEVLDARRAEHRAWRGVAPCEPVDDGAAEQAMKAADVWIELDAERRVRPLS